MSAVFYGDELQKKRALESKTRVATERGQMVRTEVLPVGEFTLAEDYHQKFYLRQSPLGKELLAVYPELKRFVDSTAVMRLNAYVGGNGTREQLKKEMGQLGLSPEGRERLLDYVRK